MEMAMLVEVGVAGSHLMQWRQQHQQSNQQVVSSSSPGRKEPSCCFARNSRWPASVERVRANESRTFTVFSRAVSLSSNTSSSSSSETVSHAQKTLTENEAKVSRIGSEFRVTKETSVEINIDLNGNGICDCDTGIPFLDHMLDQLASHGLFDVRVKAKGDTHIDDHHTNEDIALALGTALLRALGDRKGIHRFGDFTAPLDEALVHVVLDLSGRPYLGYSLDIPTQHVGNYDTQLVEHFFQSLVNTSGMTLHIRQLSGKNSHHIIEATFKAFARALRQATEYDERRRGSIPSSKGVLSRS
ncbi:unnamed protein product [Sphagnum jensenii]|uniref:Imidazoleglycerol-phosphate dehydratase n=1 Tax=Sphagnum jensenii TaxID=128206 RepID=A0ABP0VNU0_9BRYO